MTLLNWILACLKGEMNGWVEAMERFHGDVIEAGANALGLQTAVLYAVGMACAALIGVFAYKLVKLFLSLLGGGFGYLMGVALFEALGVEAMPEWLAYVFGALVGILFLGLSFGRASYVWFCLVATLGYGVLRVLVTEDSWVCLGGAFLLAMLAMTFFRIVYILFTSFGCAWFGVGFLTALLPEGAALRMVNDSWWFYGTVVGVAALLALVQFWLNRRRRKRNAA